MIRINLLPVSQKTVTRKKIKISSVLSVIIGVWFLIIFGICIDYFILKSAISTKRRDIKNLENEKQNLEEKINLVNELTKQQENIKERVNIINNIDKDRFLYARFLDTLLDCIPDKVWMVSITQKEKNLVIEGKAESNFDVSNFIKSMEMFKMFKSIKLNFIEKIKEKEIEHLRFNIEFNLASS